MDLEALVLNPGGRGAGAGPGYPGLNLETLQ